VMVWTSPSLELFSFLISKRCGGLEVRLLHCVMDVSLAACQSCMCSSPPVPSIVRYPGASSTCPCIMFPEHLYDAWMLERMVIRELRCPVPCSQDGPLLHFATRRLFCQDKDGLRCVSLATWRLELKYG
jgi:hypothetical protein